MCRRVSLRIALVWLILFALLPVPCVSILVDAMGQNRGPRTPPPRPTLRRRTMNRAVLLVTFRLVIVTALAWLAVDAVEARAPEAITQSVRFARCLRDTELSESLKTLRLQGGDPVFKI